MDKLHWFKFSPSSWMMGRIQRCSEIAQGRFVRLCCSYWNHGCEMSSEDAKLELGEDIFKELVKNRVLYTDDENAYIRFLDDQYADVEKTSSKGKLFALKRWKPDEYNKIMGIDTEKEPKSESMGTHKKPNADKIREDKRREEEIIKEDLESKFVNWFNLKKEQHLGKKGRVKTLTSTDLKNLKKLKKSYSVEDFDYAIKFLFKNKWAIENSMVNPTHFLVNANFLKYFQMEESKTSSDPKHAHLFG